MDMLHPAHNIAGNLTAQSLVEIELLGANQMLNSERRLFVCTEDGLILVGTLMEEER